MSNKMMVLGIDPSLRNFGYALAELDLSTMQYEVKELLLIETEATKLKKVVRKNSDDLERCRAQFTALREMQKKAQIAFVEVPVGSQSARAMMSYGACVALLASVDVPLIQLTPTEVKMASVGTRDATKREMIDWAAGKFPRADWLRKAGRLIDKNEHLADAVASINAGLVNEDFRALVAMRQSMMGVA